MSEAIAPDRSPPHRAPRSTVAVATPLSGRALTVIPPGSVTYDGTVHRAFRPYARLANSLTGHFGGVAVCTQVFSNPAGGFSGSDLAFDETVEIQALPEPPEAVRTLLGNLRYQWRRARAVLRLMKDWDVIYAFIPSYPGAIAYTANRFFFRRPIAVYLANDWEEITAYTFRWTGWRHRLFFSAYHRLLTLWERWIVRTAPLTITAGRALLEKYARPGAPVYETIPLLEMTSDDMLVREDTCRDGSRRLLYVGTLNARKGLPILVAALRELVSEDQRFGLDIVGDGPDRTLIEEEVRAGGLADHVHFHRFVPNGPELYRFYRQADVFVLPTYSEGFPRVLYEAMGHSVPVVASAVSGIPRLLDHERHALLVPPGDPNALADAVRRVTADAALRRNMIRESYSLVGPIIGGDPARQFSELCRKHLGLSENSPSGDPTLTRTRP